MRDLIGEEWFDILPHIEDDLRTGAFEMEKFTHNIRYTFVRWDDHWCLDSAWSKSDLFREIASLAQEGIPEEAMQIVTYEFDRSGWQRFHRITIAHSADEQVRELADRIHQVWLAQKAIDDERYAKQYEAAMQNQQAQGINDMEFEF